MGCDCLNCIPKEGWYIDDVVVSVVEPCLADAGVVRFDSVAYSCGDLLRLSVRDLNAAGDSVTVTVTTGAGDSESVSLRDSDGDGIFTGSRRIGAANDPVMRGDGIMQGRA